MSKVDWSLAPEGATHYTADRINPFYKKVNGDWMFYSISLHKWMRHPECSPIRSHELIQRPQPKPWSGPEDGLPPLGIEFEWRYGDTEWKKGEALYIGEIYVILKSIHGGEQHYYLRNMEFRAIPTPDQKRETAIRELMDIAQVDCRVTAARLVDAGFKREVV